MQGNSNSCLREKVNISERCLHAAHFIYCLINVMTVFWSFITKYSMCTCWKKWGPFFVLLVIHQKWLMKCTFVEKGCIFKKIYKWHISFFWSWQHFLDTSWHKNLRVNTVPKGCKFKPRFIFSAIDLTFFLMTEKSTWLQGCLLFLL